MLLRADEEKRMKELSIKCWVAKDKIKTEKVYETDLYVDKPELRNNGKFNGQVYISFVEIYPELKRLRDACKPGECKEVEMIFRDESPQ